MDMADDNGYESDSVSTIYDPQDAAIVDDPSLDLTGLIGEAEQGLHEMRNFTGEYDDAREEAGGNNDFSVAPSDKDEDDVSRSSSTLLKTPRSERRTFKKNEDKMKVSVDSRSKRKDKKVRAAKKNREKNLSIRRNKESGFYATSERVPGGENGESSNKGRKVTVGEPKIRAIDPKSDA